MGQRQARDLYIDRRGDAREQQGQDRGLHYRVATAAARAAAALLTEDIFPCFHGARFLPACERFDRENNISQTLEQPQKIQALPPVTGPPLTVTVPLR